MNCKTETHIQLKCWSCGKGYDVKKYNGKAYYCCCGGIVVSESGKVLLSVREVSTELKEKANAFFDSVWKLYPKKSGKSSIKYESKKKLMKAGYDVVVGAINRYKQDKDLKINGGYKVFMDGSTFFRTRWVDYVLDETNSVKEVDFSSHLEGKDLTSATSKKKLL